MYTLHRYPAPTNMAYNTLRKYTQCQSSYVWLTSHPHSNFYKTVPVFLFLDPSLVFPFYPLPSPMQPTGFSFHIFSGFLAIFIWLSSNNTLNNKKRHTHRTLKFRFWLKLTESDYIYNFPNCLVLHVAGRLIAYKSRKRKRKKYNSRWNQNPFSFIKRGAVPVNA